MDKKSSVTRTKSGPFKILERLTSAEGLGMKINFLYANKLREKHNFFIELLLQSSYSSLTQNS